MSITVPCVDIPTPMRPSTGYAANSVTDPRLNCKSRVPDIQMINRYYGLVPKKFLINRRADFKCLRSQLGFSAKQGSEPVRNNNRQKFLRSASLEGTNNLNNGRDCSHDGILLRPATTNGRRESNNNNNRPQQQQQQQEQLHRDLVAQKMKVSSHHHNVGSRRFHKDLRGRSSSLCENFYDLDHPFDCGVCSYSLGGESCQDSEGSTTPEPDVQRVIKINLHSMKWEESFNVRDEGQTGSKGPAKSLIGRRPLRKSASVQENFGTPSISSSSLGKEAGFSFPTKGDSNVKTLEPSGPSPKTAIIRARAKSAKPPPSSADTPAERRRKFGAFKTFSLSQAQQESKGESSGDDDEDPFPKSILARHSFLNKTSATAGAPAPPPGSESIKNELHVQQPPEVTTMISSIAPQRDASCKQEEDTQAMTEELLTNIIKMTNGMTLSSSSASFDDSITSTNEMTSPPPTTTPSETSLGNELNNETTSSPEKALNPSSSVSTPIEPATTMTTTTNYRRQESHYKHNVPPLRKAASISCEEEEIITASSAVHSHDALNNTAGGQVNGSKPRCKTAKVRGSVSFAKTASMKFIPARIRSNVPSTAATAPWILQNSIKKQMKGTEVPQAIINCETSSSAMATTTHYQISRPSSSSSSSTTTPSRASKNRRLLLKKALAELNQASASLNKKLKSQPHQVQIRPRTAPSQQQSKFSDKNSRRHVSLDEKNKELAASQQEVQQAAKIQQAKRRPISRQQSITFMENLFGSSRSLNGDQVRSRSLDGDMEQGSGFEENNNSRRLEKASGLSVGKREECMRIYDKMKKKGCSVSLETIFRGMMTPSEYRIFIESLEKEEEEAEEQEPINVL